MLQVLYEDNHLLAVNKPAGLPTMGVPAGQPSLLEMARRYIAEKYHKPGRAYLGVVSRLDAPVTGLVLFARTSKAAARLNEQFRSHSVEKIYWALVEGRFQAPQVEWLDYLVLDRRHRRVAVLRPDPTAQHPSEAQGAKEARLLVRRLQLFEKFSWLEIQALTGRKHQIRVQLAQHGYPILGDRKYGAGQKFPVGIALHARRLVLEHPVEHRRLELLAPLPPVWRKWGIEENRS
ncbi:MAG: RluA family pseudouridine synthase [Thermoguttaceae bacterium]|nr:RluA family pseudouridine synthase [Thermoguttaceae bacterium]MDW8037669.1 RluA family pseudouridine synthase [Thermoguttaceae bacterium]